MFNALLPPLIAALRLPYTLALGFLLVLAVDAVALVIADDYLLPGFGEVDSFGSAFLAALVMAAVSMVLQVILGTNDNDEYTLRVVRRIARRQGAAEPSAVPGIIFLEIDGLALPVLRRAMRDGNAPVMARWLDEEGYRLTEWETDLSSQTGASQAGILLGSNEDIPAFRWVEKETGTMMVCSSPDDCAEIERRHSTGVGLLAHGGASRGNLLSGEADETILTVSRIEAEKGANPGYRAFFADGVNVTQAFVLFLWEVVLEWTAAARAKRRDVRPRGHRGGSYPFLRGVLCVIVRNAIVFGVLTDIMRGRPAVYATFSSYDEVAHHSGLERADTLEALRKLDQQFARIERARALRAASLRDRRPVRSRADAGRDVQAAQRLWPRRARGALAAARRGRRVRRRRRAACDGRARRERGHRDQAEEASEERRLRSRGGGPGLRQSRPDLPDVRAAPADARGDRRAASEADPRTARAPARRLAPRGIARARPARARRVGQSRARARSSRGRRPARRLLTRAPPSTCCARTASRTSRTSWSAASTTPSATRAAPSRS